LPKAYFGISSPGLVEVGSPAEASESAGGTCIRFLPARRRSGIQHPMGPQAAGHSEAGGTWSLGAKVPPLIVRADADFIQLPAIWVFLPVRPGGGF